MDEKYCLKTSHNLSQAGRPATGSDRKWIAAHSWRAARRTILPRSAVPAKRRRYEE